MGATGSYGRKYAVYPCRRPTIPRRQLVQRIIEAVKKRKTILQELDEALIVIRFSKRSRVALSSSQSSQFEFRSSDTRDLKASDFACSGFFSAQIIVFDLSGTSQDFSCHCDFPELTLLK